MSLNESGNRKSRRLRGYDYSSAGIYHITICCQNRQNRLGKIIDTKMVLNEFGRMIEEGIAEIPFRFINCSIDAFQIMPDHLHLLIVLRTPDKTYSNDSGSNPKIGDVISAFKSETFHKCLSLCKQRNIIMGKLWQDGYHDSIIRSQKQYESTILYIYDNPSQWKGDES